MTRSTEPPAAASNRWRSENRINSCAMSRCTSRSAAAYRSSSAALVHTWSASRPRTAAPPPAPCAIPFPRSYVSPTMRSSEAAANSASDESPTGRRHAGTRRPCGGALGVDRSIDRRDVHPRALLRGGGEIAFVGVLAGVESAFVRRRQRLPDVADDVDRPVAAAGVVQHVPTVEQELQHVGVGRQQLLDMGRRPVAPRTVAERPALHAVKQPAVNNGVERACHRFHQRVASGRDAPQAEPHGRCVHVLRLRAKTAVQRVELIHQAPLQPVGNAGRRR